MATSCGTVQRRQSVLVIIIRVKALVHNDDDLHTLVDASILAFRLTRSVTILALPHLDAT